MNILSTILYIILFILCLSLLIIIHELGHLSAAKVFKVYCLEFSIGFGPCLIKRKKNGKETQFSLRAIPFGGYVSMYGEGMDMPEGQDIPQSRSLNGIKAWKRAIILVAGVFMNAVLALTCFFIDEIAVPQKQFSPYRMVMEEDSPLKALGIDPDKDIITYSEKYTSLMENYNIFVIDDEATLCKEKVDVNGVVEKVDVDVFAVFNASNFSFKDMNWTSYLEFYSIETNDKGEKQLNASNLISSEYKYVDFDLPVLKNYENYEEITDSDVTKLTYRYTQGVDLKTSFVLIKNKKTFKEAVKLTFVDFGKASTAIIRGIGMLFKPSNWNEMGGIVAIGFETTNTLQNLGLYYFIYTWAMISVNLAIFNLLPFPGLDGWQLLVLIIESIIHRPINEKVKGIISFIGIGLLFVLMAVILFKDVFKYIFLGLML